MNPPDDRSRMSFFPVIAILFSLFLLPAHSALLAQSPAPPATQQALEQQQQPPAEQLSAGQLNALVAPIALYPDPLLSQVLAASSYPLEIIEAYQWLQQNPQLAGSALVDAAQQQDWDPSVQALVLFPDVLKQLSENVKWTSALGNAFLAQQSDVMDAVQRLRNQALTAGKLASTPQETLNTRREGTQTVVEILPANPQIIYVPTYDPAFIWGPSIFAPYPWLYWPSYYYFSPGISFGFGVRIGSVFFGCCGFGWGGWGWGPNWFHRSVFVNTAFFHRFRFNDFGFGRGFGPIGPRSAWVHNPIHRLGVPYPNRQLATHFYNNFRANPAAFGSRVARPPDGIAGRGSGFASGTSMGPRNGRGVASGGALRAPGSIPGARVGGTVARTAPTGGMRVGTPAVGGTRMGAAPMGGVRSGPIPMGRVPARTSTMGGARMGSMPSVPMGGVRMGTPTTMGSTRMSGGAPMGGGARMSGSAPMGGGARMSGGSAPMGGGARMSGGGAPMGGGARMNGGGGARGGGGRR